MKILTYKVKDMPANLYGKCYRLNYGANGAMRDWLVKDKDATVVVAVEDDVVIGWACRITKPIQAYWGTVHRAGSAGYYVRVSRRREGIGTSLYAALLAAGNGWEITVWPHNTASRSFFNKVDPSLV